MKSLLTGCLALVAAGGIQALAREPAPLAQSPTTEAITPSEGGKVVWLVLRGGWSSHQSHLAIPTASMDQCETSGAELVSSKRLNHSTKIDYVGFECVEGIR